LVVWILKLAYLI